MFFRQDYYHKYLPYNKLNSGLKQSYKTFVSYKRFIQLFAESAQVFFGQSRNFLNFFYSLSYKDLCAFWPISKIGILVKSAQVRANYRGTREAVTSVVLSS